MSTRTRLPSDGTGGVGGAEQFRIPEFIGESVSALARDPDVIRHTGKVLVAASLAKEYAFTDTDGTVPHPLTLADV